MIFLTWLVTGWRRCCWRISKQALKILKRYRLKQQVSHHNKTQQRANRLDIPCDVLYLAFHKFRWLTCMTNIFGSNPIWHKRNNESISCKWYPSWRHVTSSRSNHTWLRSSVNIHTPPNLTRIEVWTKWLIFGRRHIQMQFHWFKFHWNLFLNVEWTIRQHWFR